MSFGTRAFGIALLALATTACGHNEDTVPFPDADDTTRDAGVADDDALEPDTEPAPPPSVCPTYAPIKLSGTADDSAQPAILWNGSNYIVVWSEARTVAGQNDIYSVVLSHDGMRVGGADDHLVAHTGNLATSPELAALPDGSYVVAFEDCVGGTCNGAAGVKTALLDKNGLPTGAPPVEVAPARMVQRRPYLASGLGKVYIAYRDLGDADAGAASQIVARLSTLDTTGALTGPGVIRDPGVDGQYPFVALSPDHVGMVYARNPPGATTQIVFALFSPDLVLQNEAVLRDSVVGDASNPVVQWNTSRWVAAWEDERSGDVAQIYATTITADGTSFFPAQAAYDENGNWPTIASGAGMTSLIGFYGYPGQRVFLARLQADGTLKPGQVVLDTGKFPAVAYNNVNGEYAVVYSNGQQKSVQFGRFKCADDAPDAGSP